MRTIISGYRLEHRLHRNAGHDVWLARSPGRGEPVVVKRRSSSVDPHRSGSLRREANLLADLSHPNVSDLIEVVDDPSGMMLAMAPVAGGSLRDLLDERGTLSPGEVVAVLHGVAEAVGYLADQNVVHGDIRPDHILLTPEGSPVLVGFGAATSISADPGDQPVEEQSTGRACFGGYGEDPTYLHPAVAAGGRPTARTEMFSLGVVAYECLTGRPPHRGTPAEVVALAAAGVHRPMSSWPSVPVGVADVVEQALVVEVGADDRSRAPDGAAVFVEHMQSAVGQGAVVRPRPGVLSVHALLAPTVEETLTFGPRPPVVDVDASHRPEAWRVAAAAIIASSFVVTLWGLAGIVLGV